MRNSERSRSVVPGTAVAVDSEVMGVDRDEIIRRLREVMAGHNEVILAYLFGSVERGTSRLDSDVDVAVYMRAVDEDRRFALESELESELDRELDLIVLNDITPSIAWEAMKGEKLVVRDERLELELMLQVSREAEEMRTWAQDYWNHVRQAREAARG